MVVAFKELTVHQELTVSQKQVSEVDANQNRVPQRIVTSASAVQMGDGREQLGWHENEWWWALQSELLYSGGFLKLSYLQDHVKGRLRHCNNSRLNLCCSQASASSGI